MTHRFNYFILLLSGVLLLSCNPKEAPPQPQKLDLSCVRLSDENGQDLGFYGGCTSSSDWGPITLTDEENGFLNFTDTVSLAGTVAANITELAVYPNPAVRDGALGISLRSAVPDQLVRLKLAIVDEDKNVLGQYSFRIKTNQTAMLQLVAAAYPPGKHYRLYYRASASTDASLFEGHGNFLICKKQVINGDIEGDCF